MPIDPKPVLGQGDQVSGPKYRIRGCELKLLRGSRAILAGWPDPLLGLEPAPPQKIVGPQRDGIIEKSARLLAAASQSQRLGGDQS